MTSPDLSQYMMPSRQADIGFHTGSIVKWDANGGTNQVSVLGATMNNLPVLTSAGSVGLKAGDNVGILRYKSTYFILGLVVTPGSGLMQPQTPIQLFPQFISNGTASTAGQSRVNSGVLVAWEGRVRPNQPYIEVDGVWGNVSGSGSTTYAIKLGGTSVGTWTSTTLEVARKGPFNVTPYIGQDWLKIELAITASTGTGEKAIQPLGAYFRQS